MNVDQAAVELVTYQTDWSDIAESHLSSFYIACGSHVTQHLQKPASTAFYIACDSYIVVSNSMLFYIICGPYTLPDPVLVVFIQLEACALR